MKSLLTILAAIFLTAIVAADAWAPPVFSVPSGGRGLENAKQAAQISQIKATDVTQQTSIDTLTTQMATVQPHAKATMNNCAAGNKILWDGTVWSCVSETDPTVQAFAKSPLPNCSAGQILKADGSNFSCVNSAAAGFEVDPTVYAFAKSALPNCTGGNVLTGNGTALSCIAGSTTYTETDPLVTSFAKAALPNCTGGNVLTGNGTSLSCTNPAASFSETDPVAKTFAKTTLPTCAAAQALTGNGTALSCTALGGAGIETDPVAKTFAKTTLPTCGAGQALKGDGTALSCVNISGAGVETDPKIGTMTNTKWCTTNGSTISCTTDAPAGDNLGNHTATTTLNLQGNAIVGSAGTVLDGSGGWVRSYGATGWYNGTYGGGWHMTEGTWIRAYGGKSVWVNDILGSQAGLTVGYGGATPPSTGAIIAGNVGIGTTAPGRRLDVASNVAGNGILDGIVLGQQSDNTNTIQTYIDGHWSDRTSYAGGCCNQLFLNPDVGTVSVRTTNGTDMFNVGGAMQASLMYDYDDRNYYIDPHWVSRLNDIRPNIIYDGQDTSFQVDPNGTTRLNYLNINAGNWMQYSSTGDWQGIHVDNTNSGSQTVGILKNNDGSFHIHRWNVGDILYSNADRSSTQILGGQVVVAGATVGGDGNIYMPWLGDWISNRIGQDVRWGAWPAFNGFTDTTDGSYYVDPSGTSYVNDWRPNIIYDRNDGGYYADLNNTTNLVRLVTNQWWNGVDGGVYVRSNLPVVRYWDSDNNRNWMAGSENDQFSIWRANSQGEGSGDWAQKLIVGSDGNLWLGLWGDWISNKVNQDVRWGSSPTFDRFVDSTDGQYFVNPSQWSNMHSLSLQQTSTVGYACYYIYNNNGPAGTACPGTTWFSLWASNQVGAMGFVAHSDIRKKKDVIPLTSDEARDFVEKVNPVHFTWKDTEHSSGRKTGYIAQQVVAAGYGDMTVLAPDDKMKKHKDTFDGVTVESPEGAFFNLNYQEATPYLHLALRDLMKTVENLKALFDGLVARVDGHDGQMKKLAEENAAQQKQIDALRAEIEALKRQGRAAE
ncbi:MAG: hypothetical protein QOF14_3713 [Hyphomicrobiales bacterium]|jgi:hypothetical protein|nr:hypothetical protein [Hyphomicrobiales bacterium]